MAAFWILLAVSFLILTFGADMVILYTYLGFWLIPVVFLGIEKHRKWVCIGLIAVFLLITAHLYAQKRWYELRIGSHVQKIDELETKLEQYEPARE